MYQKSNPIVEKIATLIMEHFDGIGYIKPYMGLAEKIYEETKQALLPAKPDLPPAKFKKGDYVWVKETDWFLVNVRQVPVLEAKRYFCYEVISVFRRANGYSYKLKGRTSRIREHHLFSKKDIVMRGEAQYIGTGQFKKFDA